MIKAWERTYKERQKDIDTDKLRFGIIRTTREKNDRGYFSNTFSLHCSCGHNETNKNIRRSKCSECGNTNFVSEGQIFSHYVLYKSSALHVGLTNYRYTAKINADKKCVFNNLTSVYDFEWNVLDGYVGLSKNGMRHEYLSQEKDFDLHNLSRKIPDSINRTWTNSRDSHDTILVNAIRTAELASGVTESDRKDMCNLWQNISDIPNNLSRYYDKKDFIYKYGKVKRIINIIIAPLKRDKRVVLSLESATKIDNNLGYSMANTESYLKLPEMEFRYSGEDRDNPFDHNDIFKIMGFPKSLFKLFKKNGLEPNEIMVNSYKNIATKKYFSENDSVDKVNNILLKIGNAEKLYGEPIFNYSTIVAELALEYNYDVDRLLEYCCTETKMYQGIEFRTSINTLRDYVRMSSEMGISYERYPKSLRLKHDVVSMNYKLKEDEIMNEKINSVAEQIDSIVQDSIPKDNPYTIVLPREARDFSNEGSRLHHCIASYAKRVADKESLILFMREKNNIELPLVSIELTPDFQFRQASGLGNRRLDTDEKMFVNEFIDNMQKNKQEHASELLSLCG